MIRFTEGGQKVEDSASVAARLGMPAVWADLHKGDHKCIDGRRYVASCLVTDPDCHRVAVSILRAKP